LAKTQCGAAVWGKSRYSTDYHQCKRTASTTREVATGKYWGDYVVYVVLDVCASHAKTVEGCVPFDQTAEVARTGHTWYASSSCPACGQDIAGQPAVRVINRSTGAEGIAHQTCADGDQCCYEQVRRAPVGLVISKVA
jgi:hypothetical protein